MENVDRELSVKVFTEYFITSPPKDKIIVVDVSKIAEKEVRTADLICDFPIDMINLIREILNNQTDEIEFKNLHKNKIEVAEVMLPQYNDKMVEVTGLIQAISNIKAYPETISFICDACGQVQFKEFTAFDWIDKNLYCSQCKKKTFHSIQEKRIKNFQLLTIAEMVTLSSTPNTIDVMLGHNLLDSIKPEERQLIPGTKVKIVGIFTQTVGRKKSSLLVPVLEAFYWETEQIVVEITEEDKAKILALSQEPYLIERLIEAVSPSIFGLDRVKEAILLMMV